MRAAADIRSATAITAVNAGASASFPTTHWSVVLNASSLDDATAHASLETLCRHYWYPIYAFVRRKGFSHHEAEDLTQGFFAQLLEASGLARAQPERGRFRTFILSAAKHFLIDERRRAHALKRAAAETAPIAAPPDAEQRFATDLPDPALTPEESFDRSWTLSLVDRALRELESEYAASGRGALYTAVARHVWGDGTAESHAASAARLDMTEHAFTMAVSRLRLRLRERLRTEVATTVARESDAADELRHLLGSVRSKNESRG